MIRDRQQRTHVLTSTEQPAGDPQDHVVKITAQGSTSSRALFSISLQMSGRVCSIHTCQGYIDDQLYQGIHIMWKSISIIIILFTFHSWSALLNNLFGPLAEIVWLISSLIGLALMILIISAWPR